MLLFMYRGKIDICYFLPSFTFGWWDGIDLTNWFIENGEIDQTTLYNHHEILIYLKQWVEDFDITSFF